MKVVIISRTCFPAKAPRSHRATELAKEFARKGYEVALYAYLGDYDYNEIETQTGVRFKNLGHAHGGMPTNTSNIGTSLKYRLMRFFGTPIQYPECSMIPQVKHAISSEGNIDLLVTIAVPHVIHYAAALANRIRVKCWVADCGDPFMGNPMHKPPFYFEWFERYWCKRCNYITVPVEEARAAYYKEYHDKIRVIPQGFNFDGAQLADYIPNDVPTFAYSGIFYKDLRDPSRFLEYLCTIEKPFKFICYTKSVSILQSYKEKLGDKLEVRAYIPREELLFELSKMDFLVNVPNKSGVQQPSKLIDYALTKRPILNVSSDFTDSERNTLQAFFKADYSGRMIIHEIERYNIVNVARQFLELAK